VARCCQPATRCSAQHSAPSPRISRSPSEPLLWIYVAEPFIAQQSYHIYSSLPGGLREALLHHTSAHHHIPSAATGAATLAIYVAAAIALALTRFKRQAVA
jgi:hypothetical protein